MYAHSKGILAAVLAGLLIVNSGCIFFHGYTKGRPVDEAVLKSLVVGQARKQQVESRMGLPGSIIPLSNGTIYHYEYTKANTFLLLIFGHTSREDDKLYMTFDNEGKLVEKKAQFLTKDLGWRLWPFGR